MNITGYLKKFGDKSFKEMPFSDVDALIVAQLTYLHWDLHIKNFDRSIHIKDIQEKMIKKLNSEAFNSFNSVKFFKVIQKTKRYGNARIRFVRKIQNNENTEQFFAITITLPNGMDIIGFRGTDLTLTGWKEDCFLSFKPSIPSHQNALDYTEEVLSKIKGAFYIVGHSKGGNLAYYTAINLKKEYKRRLVTAYSFDGPGFYSDEQYNSNKFKTVRRKLKKFIPKDSIIGVMLNRDETPIVVDSTYISVFQHDPFSWVIKSDGQFKTMKNRTYGSRVAEQTLINFLGKLSVEERERTTEALFTMLGKPNHSLIDIRNHIPSFVKNFVSTYSNFDKQQQKELTKNLGDLFKALVKAIFNPIKDKKSVAIE